MADYNFNDEVTISFADIKEWMKRILVTYNMREDDALVVADHLATADGRGVYSHGAMRLPIYCRRFDEGGTSPTAQPVIVGQKAATALVDGRNSMGMVAGKFATDLAIRLARNAGSSSVSVMGSNHLGTCAYWAEMMADADMVGFCWTINCVNIMAPWGGMARQLGNNPFAIAAPRLTGPNVVLDMATSVVARGKIVMATKTKTPIPETWALDKDGNPTEDAEAGYWGTVRPVGDYKGSGLTFMNAIISAILPGAAFGSDVTDLYERPGDVQNTGHLFQAIDISAISDVDAFKTRMDQAVRYLKEGPKKPGVKEILVPGEIEANELQRQKAQGITYPVEVVDELRKLSEKVGIAALA
jgi:LDH2 family malate/lactate/ureidoglycolate dehydrogenase